MLLTCIYIQILLSIPYLKLTKKERPSNRTYWSIGIDKGMITWQKGKLETDKTDKMFASNDLHQSFLNIRASTAMCTYV